MTVDALRGKSARSDRREGQESLPIGETDANIFDCPACARPLAVGTSRCPGCGTRLLAGVRATKAAGFAAAGLVVGLLVGGGVIGAVFTLARPVPSAVVEPAPVAAPSAAPAEPVASAPAPALDPTIPSSAISALRQSTLLNQRLVADGSRLVVALGTAEPASVDIARALRALAATAAFGDRIAPDVADWSDGTTVSAGLTDFYATIGATAREGLAASLNNTPAYLAAGNAMLEVMAGLPDLDAAARGLAAGADIELPPLELPAVDPAPASSTTP